MGHDAQQNLRPAGRLVRLGAVLVLGVGGVALGVGLAYHLSPRGTAGPSVPRIPPDPTRMSTPFFMPGLRQPPTLPADAAPLADEEEVLGVTGGGKHRAYWLPALRRRSAHVINDLLGDVPVSLTYCDRTGCARAFTSPERGQPLDLAVGGWHAESMLLRVDNGFYFQNTAQSIAPEASRPFPYPEHPVVRTTWGEWKKAHPDTDVYVGEAPAEGGR